MMNKLTAKDYQLLIADAMRKAYGNTLAEHNTDLDMAAEVVKALKDFLYFRENKATSQTEFKEKRRQNLRKCMEPNDDWDEVTNHPPNGMILRLPN